MLFALFLMSLQCRFVGDEVGIQCCDRVLKVFSTREASRADLEHVKATVMLWENLQVQYGPPQLIYKGNDDLVIPTEVLELQSKGLIWVDRSDTGMQTTETYYRFRRKQIKYIRHLVPYIKGDPNTEIIWIFDNHASHIEFKSVFLAALNGVHDIAGPGGQTQLYQVRSVN